MLVKRFAVIYLLYQDVPASYISESLHMSPATIARMSVRYENGKYSSSSKSSQRPKYLGDFRKILRAGLPPVLAEEDGNSYINKLCSNASSKNQNSLDYHI